MPADDNPLAPDPLPPIDEGHGKRWYQGLSGYAWFVFVVASLGWLFDTMDQQLFNLARRPAVTELITGTQIERNVQAQVAVDLGLQGMAQGRKERKTYDEDVKKAFGVKVDEYGTISTSIFMVGWAIGGIIFGILGDKIGRARTMLLTVLTYSCFTGLSAMSRNVWDFSMFRFLTGLGVGGQFAVGVAMVAEVMPDRSRPFALGMLQALSAIGNITAGLVGLALGQLQSAGQIESAWRAMFLIGLAPAVLAIPIMLRLREPERWRQAKSDEERDPTRKHELGSIRELFSDPRWRRHTLFGMLLAFSGVVGLWGIGVFSNDLVQSIFRKTFEAQGLTGQALEGKLGTWTAINLIVFNVGAFFGIYAFSRVTHILGRKPTFAIFFLLAMISTAISFWMLEKQWQIFLFQPLMGFCQLALFGGYAIYFPELFPTRLRSTGTSFCYNVGRLVAALGPLALGQLTRLFASTAEPMRPAGVLMCGVFIVGLVALVFLPETKGQPLPE